MEKIISLFKRNYDGDRQVYNEIVEGAEWVINGEGVATRKWDGTCCMVHKDGYTRIHRFILQQINAIKNQERNKQWISQ